MGLALRSPGEFASLNGNNRSSSLHEYLEKLQPFSLHQRFARGETIFCEDDDADRVYKIVEGVVRICKHTADGRRHIVDFALGGELVGLVEGSHHDLTAEAVNDVVVISYPRNRIDHLGSRDPEVGRKLLGHLYENLLVLQRHLLTLSCQDAKERLASFLLRFAERTGVAAGERLDLAMSRQDIADHLGLTIETICRTIRDLKRVGAVEVPNIHQLVVTDAQALRALAIVH